MLQKLASAAIAGLDLLLPPLCPACGAPATRAQALCPTCWGSLHFITPPYCAACGLPFEYAGALPDMLCGACLAERPLFGAARAALTYNEDSRRLILSFKTSDRTDFAPLFSRMMAQAGKELLKTCEVIMPVPLHPRRLFARRYNQAALLARALARATGKELQLQTLIRCKYTPSQGHLPRAQRAKNVAGAFAVQPRHEKDIRGKSVLLIDDVLTTGATVNACAKTLLKAGAGQVNVLALARVKKEE